MLESRGFHGRMRDFSFGTDRGSEGRKFPAVSRGGALVHAWGIGKLRKFLRLKNAAFGENCPFYVHKMQTRACHRHMRLGSRPPLNQHLVLLRWLVVTQLYKKSLILRAPFTKQ